MFVHGLWERDDRVLKSLKNNNNRIMLQSQSCLGLSMFFAIDFYHSHETGNLSKRDFIQNRFWIERTWHIWHSFLIHILCVSSLPIVWHCIDTKWELTSVAGTAWPECNVATRKLNYLLLKRVFSNYQKTMLFSYLVLISVTDGFRLNVK